MKKVIILLSLSLLGMEVSLYAIGALKFHMFTLGILGGLVILLVALFSREGKNS
ncbi:hypothetical protein [Gulbenkiania mobilis]|uniref:hypothetical protein n=1 Tax=Gulbenkiania mobilis TaxID=397457 RepID=UPI0013791B9F|nr:hypothetical protein [Gulbenkiania mobilis]